MTMYQVHTTDTAPERSRALLEDLRKSIGMIPNLAAAMSESPELLRGFLSAREIFYAGSFTPAEVQVLALTNAFENGCRYCMALHSRLAVGEGVPRDAVEALRAGDAPRDPRLAAISDFSRRLVQRRGHVTNEDLRRFLAAGYTKAQALETVLGVAVSILPNFAHHITQCSVDDAFRDHLWTPPARGHAALT